MTYRVQVSDEARNQLLAIDAWWAVNRTSAPGLVATEFGRAVTLLEAMPFAGRFYRHATSATYRRLLLRRSSFHVYYLVDENAQMVVIVAVWNAKRGHGPPLP